MLHKSQVTSLCLIGLLTGVLVRSFYDWPQNVTLAIIGPSLILPLFVNRYAKAVLIIIIAAGLGSAYYAVWLNRVSPDTIAYYNNTKVEITGRVRTEVDRRTGGQSIVLSVSNMAAPIKRALQGKVLLRLPLYPEIHYGDALRIKCLLKKPEPVEDFAYDRYLAVAHIYSICDWPKVIEQSSQDSFSVLGLILRIKKRFLGSLNAIFPEPHASLLAGLLVGSRQGIPEAVNENFKRTGLSHIVAISGYNITIIASCILGATKRWLGRKKGFWLVIGVLAVFVVLTGAQASVVRATLMGITVLLSRYLSRRADIYIIILLTAGIMTLINPLVLAFDIGFQLSFLATIGLIYFSPMTGRLFSWLPETFSIRESICSTMSATIITLPILIYYFDRVSIISPLANLMILPIIPLVMAAGFITVIIGIIWLPLGFWLNACAWLGLEYMFRTIGFLAQIRFASLENIELTPLIVWLAFGLMIVFALYRSSGTSQGRKL